ncbi:MAG TPA: hypothetical protein VLE49_15430 [Anaerolineales bacterium]|nr:hypothetical protein [Anaerolineales bacterium]
MKKFLSILCLTVVVAGFLTAAAPMPTTTFTLVQGLPATMNVGESYTVIVQVESDQPFLFAQGMPSPYYPGRGVVALRGADHQAGGTTATLQLTFIAKSSTAEMRDGVAPVHFVAGARYAGGYTAMQDFLFNVVVP